MRMLKAYSSKRLQKFHGKALPVAGSRWETQGCAGHGAGFVFFEGFEDVQQFHGFRPLVDVICQFRRRKVYLSRFG